MSCLQCEWLLFCLQGHILQMPSTRAALGIGIVSPTSTRSKQPDSSSATPQGNSHEHESVQQSVTGSSSKGQSLQGKASGQQPINMAQLLGVPPDVREMAASATDLGILMRKVRGKERSNSFHPSPCCVPYAPVCTSPRFFVCSKTMEVRRAANAKAVGMWFIQRVSSCPCAAVLQKLLLILKSSHTSLFGDDLT